MLDLDERSGEAPLGKCVKGRQSRRVSGQGGEVAASAGSSLVGLSSDSHLDAETVGKPWKIAQRGMI